MFHVEHFVVVELCLQTNTYNDWVKGAPFYIA